MKSGVVTLTGTALTAADSQKAEEIASRLAAVVAVENEIEILHRDAIRSDASEYLPTMEAPRE